MFINLLFINLTSLIPYMLKDKHCNKCIYTIIDTWQFHDDLIICMLMRSHYIHKCVHTMYFEIFFKKTHI